MKCEETTVTGIETLFGALHALGDPSNRSVCRGHARAKWQLQPSIDRDVVPSTLYSQRLDEERCLIEKFRRRAENLLGEVEWQFVSQAGPSNLVLPMTVMQHYGAPTRLLDWSMSPFVAAFFAVIDSLDQDGAVWWFRISAFESAAAEQWDRLGMRSRPGEDVDYNLFAFKEDSPPFLGMTCLRIPFERAEAQQGLFTISGRLGLLHDDLLCGLLPGQNFGKIVIPSRIKREALEMLKATNVTAKSLEHVGADRLGLRMSLDRQTARSLS
ncbi:MAG: FRG domain-containing protein [Phycisphaerales bacterium]|nr:FRG domain-containing protein [Phycisphaerales bacterium]